MVIKVGSAVLSGGKPGLDAAVIRRLAATVAGARARGLEVILVSSGAISAGTKALNLKSRPSTTQLKQAAAAVGQSRLMRAWEAALARRGLTAAQILLTREDLRDRERYLNARNTLFALLRLGVVPVINENDTVAVEEIRFGDNDGLSALVAGLVDAGLLVLLTDQDGLYDRDPRQGPAQLVRLVLPGDAPAAAAKPGPLGSGGMDSKVRAGRSASEMGIAAVIASGLKPKALEAVLAGEEEGTWFVPEIRPLEKRKAWLAFASHPKGEVRVDQGAREALVGRGKSLLPSGVRALTGVFEAGDAVSLTQDGREFARGLTNFSSRDLERIKGLKTSEVEAVLGHKPADEVVHRDNLALTGGKRP